MTLFQKKEEFEFRWSDGRWSPSDFNNDDRFFMFQTRDKFVRVTEYKDMSAVLMEDVNVVYRWMIDMIKKNKR